MKQIAIFGAGMAGLLAANMLRRYNPVVLEKQPGLPNNHKAVLRFRSPAVSNATGIPFKEVVVNKAIWDGERLHTEPNLALANRYSFKVIREIHQRSIWNLAPSKRWIAPYNFIELMAKNVEIYYDAPLDDFSNNLADVGISTMPMGVAMRMSDVLNIPTFTSKPVWTVNATMTEPLFHVNQTIYNCDLNSAWYRGTIQDNTVILEFANMIALEDVKDYIHEFVSILIEGKVMRKYWEESSSYISVSLGKIQHGKIIPIDEKVRKDFIFTLTQKHNVFSLGRFATWRNILLDDCVQDVTKIEKLIFSGDYERRMS